MKLDARTIVLILVIGSLLMSGGLYAVARGFLGQVHGLKQWAHATLLQGIGWILFGVLRGFLPEWASVGIGGIMIQGSLLWYLLILARFNQYPLRINWMLLLLAGYGALLLSLAVGSPNLAPRILLNSSVASFLMFKSVHVLWRGERAASHWFTGALLAMCGSFLLMRAGYYLLFYSGTSEQQFATSLINDISYLIFFITAVFLTVGFLLMCTERLLQMQKQMDKLQTEFISTVSHELRTPLTSIRGSLSLIEGGVVGVLPPQAQRLISIAHKNSLRLVNLVNDILDMEKLASGQLNLNLQALDLVSLLQQAIDANAAYGATYGVSYHLEIGVPVANVQADAARLMQVMANLLSNAAKFSASGSQVRVVMERQEAFWRVAVIDQGKGVPPEFRNRIFSRFAQADGSDSRNLDGAGLGLHITRVLVEKMAGSIGFESEPGKGSVFWFVLPAASVD
jgi:signal transduction histidine kinase